MIEEALYDRLTNHAGLAALVAGRVYDAQTVPQRPATPFVTYQRVSSRRVSAGGEDTGVVAARFQLTAWADTYAVAKAVKEQVRAAVQRWRGAAAGAEVLDTYVENDFDMPFEPDTEARGVGVDVLIWHRE